MACGSTSDPIAAGLAAVAALSPSVGAWAAVVTTAGGAVTAYIAAQRYEFLWIEYSRTASELRRLLERRTAADGTPLSGPELVAKCEDVISVQNQAWMAGEHAVQGGNAFSGGVNVEHDVPGVHSYRPLGPGAALVLHSYECA